MKHEFANADITAAADQAANLTSSSYYRAVSIEYHRHFLDALPEPDSGLRDSKDDINTAAMAVGWSCGYNHQAGDLVNGIPIHEMQAFLAHLRDQAPTDDVVDAVVWEECEFDDFHPTDKRVRAVFHYNDTIIEGKPTGLFSHGRALGLGGGVQIKHDDEAIFYRIPAPVVHPDLVENPVIIVSGAYGVDWDKSYAYISDGFGYHIAEPNNDSVLLPKAITKWGAAKVVAADE